MITSPGKLYAGMARSPAIFFWFIQDITITGGAANRIRANMSVRLFGIGDHAIGWRAFFRAASRQEFLSGYAQLSLEPRLAQPGGNCF